MADDTPGDNDAADAQNSIPATFELHWRGTSRMMGGGAAVKFLGDGRIMKIELAGFTSQPTFRINQTDCGRREVTRRSGRVDRLHVFRPDPARMDFVLTVEGINPNETLAMGFLRSQHH